MTRIWTDSRVRGIAQAERSTTEGVPMILRDSTSVPTPSVRNSTVLKAV
jgi:hypothetical protein